jgi:periplasmic divalent cation tolerance protein
VADPAGRVVVALTTVPSGEVGHDLARALVGERLAACVNVLPAMASVYRWNGELQQDTEHQLVIKTTVDRVDAIQARVGQLHPYALPEFLVLPVQGGSARYLGWIIDSVSVDAGPDGAV